MLLHGPFEVLDFSEILRLLATKGETGRLDVAGAGVAAKLYFARGHLTWAEVDERRPTVPSEAGPNDRLVDACARFVDCARGTFEFEHGVTSPSTSEIEGEVERTLALAKVRAAEWREIAIAVPSLEVHPSLASDVVHEPVILSRDLWRLVAAIDGRRSVSALARVTGMSTFSVCRHLKKLVEQGAVKIASQPKTTLETREHDGEMQRVEEGLVKVFADQPATHLVDRCVDEATTDESGADQPKETEGARREKSPSAEKPGPKG